MKSSLKNFSSLLKRSFASSVGMAAVFLTSCQIAHVKSGAEKLRILETEPKGCLFMGEVSTVQDNNNVSYSGGEVDMSLNTRIELRNKAFDQNANVLVFTSKGKAKLAGATPEKKDKADAAPAAAGSAGAGQVEKPAETVFLGTTFRCPPLIFNQ